jgi:hypothetical protein
MRLSPTSSAVVVLARSPEMAMVELLESAVAIATRALFAANPELESGEFLAELPEPSVQACLADAVLTHLNGLETAINNYCTYVVEHHERSVEDTNPDF